MNKRIFALVYGLIAIIGSIVAFMTSDSEKSLSVIGYCCTIILFSFLLIDYRINKGFSYSALFVLILFLFHFGQLILFTYFSNSYEHIRFLGLLEVPQSLYGFRIMTASLSALCFGILWKASECRKNNLRGLQFNINWINFAKRIIYATFFVKFVLDITTLTISFTSGGFAARTFVNSFPNVLLFYGKISLLGFAILLVALKSKPKSQNKLFVFIMGYLLLMMMSGIRSENVGYLVVFLFIYLQSRINPLGLKQIALYSILVFFGLTFIVAVGQFRDYSKKDVGSFMELSKELLTKKNVVLGLFDTCGDTGYTAQEALNEYLPKYGPSKGDAYYKGIFAVIPNVAPFIVDFGKITEESSHSVKLQNAGVLNKDYENIGGSFFAEQYMNFGVFFGIIVCFLWGIFFGWVGKISVIAFKTNNIYQLLFMIPIMLASAYWVRSYFGGGIREVTWDILLGLYFLRSMNRVRCSNISKSFRDRPSDDDVKLL